MYICEIHTHINTAENDQKCKGGKGGGKREKDLYLNK